MYATKTDNGGLQFAVESHKGFAGIVIKDGVIIEALYGDKPGQRADFMHKKSEVLRKMADVSLACFVEVFENLNVREPVYEEAKCTLEFESRFHNEELKKRIELQTKMNQLLE